MIHRPTVSSGDLRSGDISTMMDLTDILNIHFEHIVRMMSNPQWDNPLMDKVDKLLLVFFYIRVWQIPSAI